MNIEVLLTEAEIAQEFADSMEARDLPEKFFYWFPLSVRAWRELAAEDPHRSLVRTWDGFSANVASLAANFPDVVPVVSFGAGDGAKDHILLNALKSAGKGVKYFPVDASQSLLETACAAAEDDDFEVLGIKADISSPMHLVLASDAAESPRLFLMNGNTLGGFDPMEQIRHVADCLRGNDRLIIDAGIYSEQAARSEENLKLVRFAFAPLASIGVQEDDGQVRFEPKKDSRHTGMHLITKRFHAQRDLRISVAGKEIQVARGERIFMNFRYLFTPEAFRWLLQKHAGMKILSEVISADGAFMTAVCSC